MGESFSGRMQFTSTSIAFRLISRVCKTTNAVEKRGDDRRKLITTLLLEVNTVELSMSGSCGERGSPNDNPEGRNVILISSL